MRSGHTRGPVLLSAVIVVVSALLMLAASPAGAATATGPIPGDPGPAGPSITTFDPGLVGYTRSEFFLSGAATSYVPVAGSTLASDGRWQVVPSETPVPFTTRLTVMRPSDPAAFDGTVIVEWLNVTSQSDSGPDWLGAHNEIIRQGHAWVGVSAQAVGVDAGQSIRSGALCAPTPSG